jgi:hypothetical protein
MTKGKIQQKAKYLKRKKERKKKSDKVVELVATKEDIEKEGKEDIEKEWNEYHNEDVIRVDHDWDSYSYGEVEVEQLISVITKKQWSLINFIWGYTTALPDIKYGTGKL